MEDSGDQTQEPIVLLSQLVVTPVLPEGRGDRSVCEQNFTNGLEGHAGGQDRHTYFQYFKSILERASKTADLEASKRDQESKSKPIEASKDAGGVSVEKAFSTS